MRKALLTVLAGVVAALALERDAARHPLVDVMFALQDSPVAEMSVPGLRVRPGEVSTGNAKFDLLGAVRVGPPPLRGVVAQLVHRGLSRIFQP